MLRERRLLRGMDCELVRQMVRAEPQMNETRATHAVVGTLQ